MHARRMQTGGLPGAGRGEARWWLAARGRCHRDLRNGPREAARDHGCFLSRVFSNPLGEIVIICTCDILSGQGNFLGFVVTAGGNAGFAGAT